MSFEPADYSPPDRSVWTGRVDGGASRDACRWHQVVECLDLREAEDGAPERSGFCLLGYSCGEGVARNLGRSGAERGPHEIRRQLANLPVSFDESVAICDSGNVHCPDGDVERAQRTLAAAVARVLERGLFPVVLGGGHDLAFGQFLGLTEHQPASRRLGVINFDAHFDLRPVVSGASSGTAFSQIAELCRRTRRELSYLCIGVQRLANTVSLFRRAEALGVEVVLAADIEDARPEAVLDGIDGFLARQDAVYVTICADVLSSAFAPGVSAPQPFGLQPETVLRLLKHILRSGKVVSFDFAEVSPRFDSDNNTAKVAAVFVYALVNTLAPPDHLLRWERA